MPEGNDLEVMLARILHTAKLLTIAKAVQPCTDECQETEVPTVQPDQRNDIPRARSKSEKT